MATRSEPAPRRPAQLDAALIAPCGLNCGVCRLAFRATGACPGCRSAGTLPKYCATCRIRNCDQVRRRGRRFCVDCPDFPCPRLRRMDRRYQTRYGVSVIENLRRIRDLGLDRFVRSERRRWRCGGCGALLSVHKPACLYCARPRARRAPREAPARRRAPLGTRGRTS